MDTEKRKTGRPPKSPGQLRNALAACRLTQAEYAVLTAAAEARGMTNADLIRAALAHVLSTDQCGVVEPSAAAA